MNGAVNSGDALDERRRRVRFRAWHRGIREMDLILGRFADASIEKMSQPELEEFERLMGAPDPDLFNWIIGAEQAPTDHETPLLRRLRAFHLGSDDPR